MKFYLIFHENRLKKIEGMYLVKIKIKKIRVQLLFEYEIGDCVFDRCSRDEASVKRVS